MASKTKRPKPPEVVAPTDEQLAGAKFVIEDTHDKLPGGMQITIGKAYRRKPMIEILLAAHLLSADEYRALKHYRHHADMADRSPVRDSLCIQRGGRGNGPALSTLNACRVRDDCERAAGSLADILRAVVVYDLSLSQWAIGRGGSIQVDRKRGSAIEPRRGEMEAAKLEIRMVARRVMAELDAGKFFREAA